MNVADGSFLVCTKVDHGWIVCLFGHDNKLKAGWQNFPTEKTQFGIQLINHFINANGKSVNPVFEKEFMDAEHNIERKSYATDIGPIVLHSRRHPVGTEVVIQVIGQGLILRYLWERSTSSIDPNLMQELSVLPF